ncbi:MAG: LysM peptidoglycan-binding domain-containing protein [Chloroflexi bacterium]|nr:LysM peptidoglycan-binding domain-containing protein [Chloroflexota bacterium]
MDWIVRVPLRRGLLLAALSTVILSVWIVLAQEDTAPGAPLSGTVTYEVAAGDTLDAIAARFDVQLVCLIELNELATPGTIFPGEILTISDTCPRYTGIAPVANPRPEAPVPPDIYIIERGDTLDTIGQRFNVSVLLLQQINELAPGQLLFPGQPLRISTAPGGEYGQFPFPPLTSDGERFDADTALAPGEQAFLTQPGDIFDLIALFYDVELTCFAERNNLQPPDFILPGIVLVVPGGCPPYAGLSTLPPNAIRGIGLDELPDDQAPVTLPRLTPTPPPAAGAPPNPVVGGVIGSAAEPTPVPPTATATFIPATPTTAAVQPPAAQGTLSPFDATVTAIFGAFDQSTLQAQTEAAATVRGPAPTDTP